MARCSFAVWRPITENATQPKITPTQAIAHSAVDAPGPTTLFHFFNRTDVFVETHFFIKFDGVIEQYMDTNVRADGNRYANVRAVSFETEDDGDPNRREWSPAQIRSIKRLLAWLFVTHPQILPRMCPAWNEPGVGYHSMWGAPSPWTPSRGKTCPGVIRKLQWAREIEPWIRGWGKRPDATPELPVQEDDDMPIIISAKGQPAALLSGNEFVPFADEETLWALARAGVKHAPVSRADYQRFNNGFSQSADVMRYMSKIATNTRAIDLRVEDAVRKLVEEESK